MLFKDLQVFTNNTARAPFYIENYKGKHNSQTNTNMTTMFHTTHINYPPYKPADNLLAQVEQQQRDEFMKINYYQ